MTPIAGPASEWPAALDIGAEMRSGWRPVPFREFVLKLHGRCDLACDYCYMYTLADPWRGRPASMPRPVIDGACRRIAEHAAGHGLDAVDVVLHGGEPLLAGPERIGYVATTLRSDLPAGTRLTLRTQTNGVRLDEPMLRVLARHRITVGVSLDGGRPDHDRHRRRRDGRGSFDEVSAGLRRLISDHPELFSGLLCTVDLRNDPVATYQALLEFSPPAVDFLLPHGNWSVPPPGRDATGTGTPYGDWLAAVFDRWSAPARRETTVRLFQEILHLLLGGASRSESVGLSPVAVLVLETDGTMEQVDTLRSAYPGAVATGLNVATDSFDAALTHPGIVARQIGLRALSGTCLACRWQRVCGGGYYPHRYRRGSGFRNPSVYCPDLTRLIEHVYRRLRSDLLARAEHPC